MIESILRYTNSKYLLSLAPFHSDIPREGKDRPFTSDDHHQCPGRRQVNRRRQSDKKKKEKKKTTKTVLTMWDQEEKERGRSRLHIIRIPAKRCAVIPKDAAIKEEDALVVETDGAVHCFMCPSEGRPGKPRGGIKDEE